MTPRGTNPRTPSVGLCRPTAHPSLAIVFFDVEEEEVEGLGQRYATRPPHAETAGTHPLPFGTSAESKPRPLRAAADDAAVVVAVISEAERSAGGLWVTRSAPDSPPRPPMSVPDVKPLAVAHASCTPPPLCCCEEEAPAWQLTAVVSCGAAATTMGRLSSAAVAAAATAALHCLCVADSLRFLLLFSLRELSGAVDAAPRKPAW